jgi:glutamate/tyrosine decarboxylase-like PLP-dependent enzyme
MSLRDLILELEQQSGLLEPNQLERELVRDKVIAYGENFLSKIDSLNAYNRTEDKGSHLLDSPIAETGIDINDAIELVRENVDRPGLNPASGGHLAYIPGGGIYYSSLGDYLAAVFNRYAGVFYASPGAVRMENMLLRWLCDIVGYGPSSHGNLTTSGSLANLIAVVVARDARGVKAADIPRSVIYLSKQTHHSVDKGIRVAGLGECPVRFIELDDRKKMRVDDLRAHIEADKAAGLRPFLIVSSAGTTDVGAIDPLPEIARLAAEHSLWHHVDAAYGGFFILTDEGREKLKGIELGDSVVIDPHKGLFLPYGLGVVLVKNVDDLKRSFSFQANYMQDAFSGIEELSPAELSPELTKHFRGLRLWLPLKLHGIAPFRACLDEKLALAKYFYEQVQQLGFESDIEPELSVVTYRWPAGKGGTDEFNRQILEGVVADGRVFISSTVLDGKYTLRFACLAFRTHLKTVDTLLTVLRSQVDRLSA